jgi:hypothetical protein
MIFHVYLRRGGVLPGNGNDIAIGDRLVFSSQAMTGARASMIYIHGPQEEWDTGEHKDWLYTSVMTRLEDANPARVVWCHD